MFTRIPEIVREYFTATEHPCTVDAGAGAREAQTNYSEDGSNRVVFTTRKELGVVPPRFVGDEPRQLFNVDYAFEVSISGFDREQPDNELAHQAVCLTHLEKAAQAIQAAYFGEHVWESASWSTARKYARHGAELVAILTLNLPIFDRTGVIVKPAPRPGEPKPVPPPDDD